MNAKKTTAQHKTKSAIAKLRRPNMDIMAGKKITGSTKTAIKNIQYTVEMRWNDYNLR